MLSKVQWNVNNHQQGELWTIDKTIQLHAKVDRKELSEESENLRGCTKVPLCDSVPIF
jgi:hypothetical protein